MNARRHWLYGAWLLLLAGPVAAVLPGRLVDATWLQQRGTADLVIVDVRSQADYQLGHVPGAINMPLRFTSGRPPRVDMVASQRDMEALLGSAGITPESAVVLYDDGAFLDAARAVWVLELYGHANVALLDGGFRAWQAVGGDLQLETVQRPPTTYHADVVPARLATLVSTRVAIGNPDVQIVDARSAAEFAGTETHSRHAGHIPGAINIPSSENIDHSGPVPHLKSRDELAALYAGLDPGKRVIAYCNKGRDAALTNFVLKELGFEVSAFDGGWYEWGNRDDTPIVLPAPPAQ